MTYKEKVAWLQRYLKAREKANFLGGCVQEMEAEAQGMRTRLDGLVIFRGILQANIVPAFRAMLAAAGSEDFVSAAADFENQLFERGGS